MLPYPTAARPETHRRRTRLGQGRHRTDGPGRRRLLKAAVLGGGAAAITGVAAYASQSASTSTGPAARESAGTTAFVHPGMLHTKASFRRTRTKADASLAPWTSGLDRLRANPHAAAGWTPRPLATVIRGGDGQNYPQLYKDVHAAYQNALLWRLTRDPAHGDTARDILRNGEGNGALRNAIPYVHGDLAQWQESGRDQGHTLMGIGLMGTICEMAWNQNVDLYAAGNFRFRKACEYVARYNLGYDDVPFTTYSWGTGQSCAPQRQTVISAAGRGQVRPVWERVYHHYRGRLKQSCPNMAEIVGANGPEGGGGDYGPNSGGYDELGFGTLTYTV